MFTVVDNKLFYSTVVVDAIAESNFSFGAIKMFVKIGLRNTYLKLKSE